MACIQKLNKAISFGCTGGLAGIEALYLVSRDTIQSTKLDYAGSLSDIALKGFYIDQNVVSSNVQIQDGSYRFYYLPGEMSAGSVVSVGFKYTTASTSPVFCHVGGVPLGQTDTAGTNIVKYNNITLTADQAGKGFNSITQVTNALYDLSAYCIYGPSALNVDTKVVPVDCHRNSVKLIDTLRTSDVGDRLEQTLSITLYDKADTETLTKLVNGSFVAFVKMKELGAIYAVGLNNGLTIASADMDSSTNGGFTSITLKTPEGCVGEQRTICTKETWGKVLTLSI